jgi:tetratricopeptide (TPR) repeat protein
MLVILASFLSLQVSAQEAIEPAAGLADCPEGLKLFEAGKKEAAKARFIECAEASPESVELMLALATIFLRDGQGYDALQWTSRALEVAPEVADVYHRHGQALIATGDDAGARSILEQGLTHSNEHPGILAELAALLLANGEDQGGYGLLSQLVRTGQATPETHRVLSDLAARRMMWKMALHHYKWYLDTSTNLHGGNLRYAGELAIMAQDTSFALLVGRDAVRLDPVPESFASLGKACFAAKRWPEARSNLEMALQGDPNDADTRFNLANTLQLMGEYQEAEGHFRQYVAQRPDDPIGFFNFASQLQLQGRLEEALIQAEQSHELAPESLNTLLLIANLQESLGDDPAALQTIDKMMALPDADQGRLEAWKFVIDDRQVDAVSHVAKGEVKLMHLVTADARAVREVQSELNSGKTFSELVVRFSTGPSAATGGDIGWVNPDEMETELGDAIRLLGVQEISPPVESGGLFHIFKRVQ